MQRSILRTTTCVGLLAALAASSYAARGKFTGGDVPGVGEPGGPSTVLSPADYVKWLRGRVRFDTPFHKSDGLGTPELNADSCRACHQDPAVGGAGGLELNVSRFGYDNGGLGPFQNLPGGQGLSKLRPPYVEGREEYDPLVADVFEQRQTPTILGHGFIDAIPDVAILANEDPGDMNGDGIVGVARIVDVGGGMLEVGRFGWKGQVPHIGDFIRDAMAGECGITTPDDGRGFALTSDGDGVSDPELSQAELDDMLFFLQNLAAPRRAHLTRASTGATTTNGNAGPQTGIEVVDRGVIFGETVFDQVGCAKCHIPELPGAGGIPVALYSDLLLHDVMPTDYRGMEEPDAAAGVFQTPPLWGIRFTPPYMHDGRAETIEDAILAHFSEAEAVRQAYEALSSTDRLNLLAFLADL
jgi:CxxC motif-containing protein (DUF1111 family)